MSLGTGAALYKALEKQAARRHGRRRPEPPLPAARAARPHVSHGPRPQARRRRRRPEGVRVQAAPADPQGADQQLRLDRPRRGRHASRRWSVRATRSRSCSTASRTSPTGCATPTRTPGASTATGSASGATSVKELGDLEPRLLKFVLAELRRDLRSRESRYRTIYDRRHSYYWAEKEADFAKVAEEVLAERKQSSAVGRVHRRVPVLRPAAREAGHRDPLRGPRAEDPRRVRPVRNSSTTCTGRSATPSRSRCCCRSSRRGRRTSTTARRLMHAYFRTEQAAGTARAARSRPTRTSTRRTGGARAPSRRWPHSCLENALFAQSVAYYEELIPLHQRTHPRRGIGNGTLSSYYAQRGAGLRRAGQDEAGRRYGQRRRS